MIRSSTHQYYVCLISNIVSLTYRSRLINEQNWLKQLIPFHYEPLCLYLFSWLTQLIITVWHVGPTLNGRDWVHALLTGGGFATVAQMPRQPIGGREGESRGESERESVFFTCKCYNVIINTWHGAWLNYPACLIKGAPRRGSVTFPLSVMFRQLLFPFLRRLLLLFVPLSLCVPLDSFLSSSLRSLSPFFLPSHPLPGPVNRPPSLPSLSCFHGHTLSLFPSIGFNRAKFCEEPLAGAPLGTRKWQKAAFIYLCGPYRVVCLIMWLIDNTVSPLARTRTMGNLIHI